MSKKGINYCRSLNNGSFFIFAIPLAILIASCGGEECPQVSLNDQSFQIDENSATGTIVGNITPSEHITSFEVNSGNTGSAFEITPDGVIKVSNPSILDYEEIDLFNLEIQARISDCDMTNFNVSIAINDLVDEIYRDPVFSSISVEEGVVYGEAVPEEQIMKVYIPEENTDRRPLLVIAVGGGMSFGHLEGLANTLSKAGYVVASIRYRPGGQEEATLRNIYAAQDLKAAIRYFRKDADTNDHYRIDANNIFAGGFGFGAFTAHRAAYVTEEDVSSEVLTVIEEHGGFEGDRGNAGYSSLFKALVTLSGGIDDLDYIDNGESPLIAIHSSYDVEVPCEIGQFDDGTPFWGSCSIIDRAEQVGIENRLVLIETNETDDHDAPVACTWCFDDVMAFFSMYLE